MCCRIRAGGCRKPFWRVLVAPAAGLRILALAQAQALTLTLTLTLLLLPVLWALTIHLAPAPVFAAESIQHASAKAASAVGQHKKSHPALAGAEHTVAQNTAPNDAINVAPHGNQGGAPNAGPNVAPNDAPSGTATPIIVSDDTGHEVRLRQPARRVIALYGAFNELLLALGAGDVLAARTVADAAVPGLEHLPAIGTHMRPNAELVVAQSPDLVIQLAGRNEALLQTESLRALGLDVLVFEMNSFEQMFAVLHKLGRLTGREAEAAALVATWQKRLAALEARYANAVPVSVFYEVRYPNLLGAGGGGIVNDMIQRAGGRNVIADEKKLVRFNEEALLAADPDVYIMQRGPMNPAPQPLEQRQHYKSLRTAREGRVFVVDEDRFSRPGPRAVDAAEELGRFLHSRVTP